MKDRIAAGALARMGLLTDDEFGPAAEIVKRMAAEGIETLRVLFADSHGVLRGKTLTAAAVPGALANGLRAPSTLLLKDLSHRTQFPIWSATGDAPLQGAGDILLAPRPESFRQIPHAPHSALILCDLATLDGAPIPFGPRTALTRAEAQLAAAGYRAVMGLEVEFQIFEVTEPALEHRDATMPHHPPETRLLTPGWQFLTETRYDAAEPTLDEIRRGAEAMGMAVQSVEIEMGPSQFEFTFAPAGPTAIADMAVVFRTMVKEICARRGLAASFMAKPKHANAAANGWHIHQSLTDARGETNLFAPGAGGGLTPLAGQWLAGLLANAKAASLLTVPTVTGYKRYQPYQLAPTRIGWGEDNRGAMVRALTAPGDPASRLENRAPESGANPYLALAAQIVSGVDGVSRSLAPPPPLANPYDDEAEMLPASLGAAIDAFAASPLFRAALGDEFVDHLTQLKRAEWDRYLSAISDWEQAEYFAPL